MYGIDVSDNNGSMGFKISSVIVEIDFAICKATQGVNFVDKYCDVWVQTLITAGKPWGFYHFGDARNDARSEAEYFYRNCENYFGVGIPVLDWESLYDASGNVVSNPSVDWVNTFTKRLYELTGVHPWIYGNPWRFAQGEVDADCGRWAASYPDVISPPLHYDGEAPAVNGLLAAWQFCSDGRLPGYGDNLDFDIFYGDTYAWSLYAKGDRTGDPALEPETDTEDTFTFENDRVKIDVELK